MQYNHRVTIQFVSGFDDYGQPEAATTKTMQCCILDENLTGVKEDAKHKNKFDMTMLVSAKTYSPYSELFNDRTLRILRGGRKYGVTLIKQINGFSGKPKYFQIFLSQVFT